MFVFEYVAVGCWVGNGFIYDHWNVSCHWDLDLNWHILDNFFLDFDWNLCFHRYHDTSLYLD